MPRFSFHRLRTSLAAVTCPTFLALAVATGNLLGGCMSLVPHNDGSIPLANGITEYRNPTFENRVALPGWIFIGGVTAGGAWKGYTSNIALQWTGWERRSEVQPIGNAMLGALSGMATSLLVTLIVGGETPSVTSDNAGKWLDRLNDRMILIAPDTLHPGQTLASIRAIASNADAGFVIHTLDDARLFVGAFRDSPYRDQILATAISVFGRDSLLAFARLAQGLPAERLATERYIAGIASFTEALALASQLAGDRPIIERRAAALILTFTDLRQFMQLFPESALAEAVAVRLCDRLKRDEIPEFVALFPSLKNQHELKLRYLGSCRTTTEAIEVLHRYPELELDAERRAASLAHSEEEYRAYLAAFPEGASAQDIQHRLRSIMHNPETDHHHGR